MIKNIFKKRVVKKHCTSSKNKNLRKTNHKIICLIWNDIYEYISMIGKNIKVHLKFIENEFSVVRYMLFNEKRNLGINPTTKEIIEPTLYSQNSTRSYNMLEELARFDIKIQGTYMG